MRVRMSAAEWRAFLMPIVDCDGGVSDVSPGSGSSSIHFLYGERIQVQNRTASIPREYVFVGFQ